MLRTIIQRNINKNFNKNFNRYTSTNSNSKNQIPAGSLDESFYFLYGIPVSLYYICAYENDNMIDKPITTMFKGFFVGFFWPFSVILMILDENKKK